MNIKYTEPYNTDCGLVRGEKISDTINVFKGIPYAEPPIKEKRFRAVGKHKKWDGVLDCVEFGKTPMQVINEGDLWTNEFLVSNREVSEDCLTLNIWTNVKKNNMPVIVYFYGGGLTGGGSSCEIYDGKTLAEHGVILVTFNRREGTFSLFTSEKLTEESINKTSGNLHLIDSIECLKWVKNNIAQFGGNPNNVTIMGQSSGAICVSALSISSVAKNLFNRYIVIGYNDYINVQSRFISKEEGYKYSEKGLKKLGLTYDEMFTVDAKKLLEKIIVSDFTIDGYVIKEKVKEGVDKGCTNDYISIIGAVPGDKLCQSLFIEEMRTGKDMKNKQTYIPKLKKFFGKHYATFVKLYDFENKKAEEILKEVNKDFTITSMLYFAEGRKLAGCKKPTYVYYYTHVLPGPMQAVYGAFHSCEVPYFFNHFSDLRKEYWSEEDFELGEYMCENLAKLVNDNEISDFEKANSNELSYYLIDGNKKEYCSFDKEKYEIWRNGFNNAANDWEQYDIFNKRNCY